MNIRSKNYLAMLGLWLAKVQTMSGTPRHYSRRYRAYTRLHEAFTSAKHSAPSAS